MRWARDDSDVASLMKYTPLDTERVQNCGTQCQMQLGGGVHFDEMGDLRF